jgi:hypothetical protein
MSEFFPRAPRLPLKAPIACRTSAAVPWVEGWTVNISRSGVLFSLPAASLPSAGQARADVEFVIRLSRGALQGPGVAVLPDLHCRGRVVRVAAGPSGDAVVAASIRRQSLRRANTTEASRGAGHPPASS